MYPKKNNYGRRPLIKQREHHINEDIDKATIRIVGDHFENGIVSTKAALAKAKELELDLVEISPNADPPVCKIMDYNKFIYEKKRKEKEMKAKSSKNEIKEIRFTPNTDDHDFDFKSKHAEKFLQEGNKVKAYVQFRGRAIMFKDRGELILLKFAERLSDFGALEGMPKLEGKRMHAIFNPKAKKK
ncbi:MAG: translation initiation factor IF-3 [Chitinophagaceae bacterium]